MQPTSFPSWLPQSPQMGELQQTYRGLGKAFDTSGVENSYGNQMGYNLAAARNSTATMGRAAEGRAFQSGGKVGSSFAAAGAMLPYYEQNERMAGDLADYKLRAVQTKAGLQASIGGQLASLRQQNTNSLASFYGQDQAAQQQAEQFGKTFGAQQKQQDFSNALTLRQQGDSESQYRDAQDQLRLSNAQKANPTGLPTWGAASTVMGAVNADNPAALAYWQRLQQATNAGGYADTPIFSTGGYPSGGGGGSRRGYASGYGTGGY